MRYPCLLGLAICSAQVFWVPFFLAAVTWQVRSRAFHPYIYWFTIIATTTVGTTMADFADRSLGIGYPGGSLLLLTLLLTSLFIWYRTTGSIAVNSIHSPQSELFYWITIMFSQTLGTALGDWVADTQGLGYLYSAIIFGSLLALTAVAYCTTTLSRTALFWFAFVVTRPLGAVLGDFIDKPIDHGGLELSRYTASLVLLVLIAVCLVIFRQRAAQQAH